ncbi:MAG: alpha/beta hydrolase [Propionibacteriaceae bacterium]|nr:alpha/beta hydrolase [Micropruina sp.]HBX80249.1 hypothetical protein [Propionibacteriaceae bacterium]HBY23842.1 hypothetical protein [Propionibacteriaceae bacterium]
MQKFVWALIYILTFLLSLVGGAALAQLHPGYGGFGGIEPVKWDASVGTSVTDLAYGPKPLNKFDLYLPADRSRSTFKLVLYIHAGGFTGGDKADDAMVGQYFASKGYVGATINYSLRNNTNNATLYDMSDEIKQGVTAIVKAAAERGYPVDAMAVAGGSAGGNLAMTYAYRDAKQGPVPVKAVISFVGPASFEPADWFALPDRSYATDQAATAGAGFVKVITGKDVTLDDMRTGQYKTYLRDVSPCDLVTKDSPPTLAAYGALDKVAPYAASTCLATALETNAVPHDVLVFPKSGHALQRDADMNKQLGVKLDEYLTKYLPR